MDAGPEDMACGEDRRQSFFPGSVPEEIGAPAVSPTAREGVLRSLNAPEGQAFFIERRGVLVGVDWSVWSDSADGEVVVDVVLRCGRDTALLGTGSLAAASLPTYDGIRSSNTTRRFDLDAPIQLEVGDYLVATLRHEGAGTIVHGIWAEDRFDGGSSLGGGEDWDASARLLVTRSEP